jgi:hypothetical protein
MRPIRGLTLVAAIAMAALPAVFSRIARGDITYNFTMNTQPLLDDAADGPYSLFFGLNGSNGSIVTLSDFNFGGGSAGVDDFEFGATGDAANPPIVLGPASGASLLLEDFTPGTVLDYTIDVNANLSSSSPDTFDFAIVGANYNSGSDLPTVQPGGPGDLAQLVMDVPELTPSTWGFDTTADANLDAGGSPTLTLATTSVPEPGSQSAALAIVAMIFGWSVRRRTARRRAVEA